MKSLFSVIVIGSFLTIAITGCASNSKKTEAPKLAEEKTSTSAVVAVTATPKVVPNKAVKATGSVAAAAGTLNCVSGSDTRIVELKTVGAGCELVYTKNAEAKSIATAKNGVSYCDGVSKNLVSNLNAAGFNCK